MFRYNLFLSTALFLASSCQQKQQETQNHSKADSIKVDSLAILTDPTNTLNIQGMNVMEIDSSGIMMLPLSLGSDESNSNSSSYLSRDNSRFWNIIFLNSKTNEHHLLTDKKMLINIEKPNYNINYSSDGQMFFKQQSKRYLFYTVILDDYNKDKSLSQTDPQYLFVSDKAGKYFRQISPANYDLQHWQFINATNKVLLTLKKDSDKNNLFDSKDELVLFEVEIEKGTEAKEVLSNDFMKKLKILYGSNWKQEK